MNEPTEEIKVHPKEMFRLIILRLEEHEEQIENLKEVIDQLKNLEDNR